MVSVRTMLVLYVKYFNLHRNNILQYYNCTTTVAYLDQCYASFTIDNVSVKEVLGQEVVPDSGCGSWLLEPQSTNLIPYSEDFSQCGFKTRNCKL